MTRGLIIIVLIFSISCNKKFDSKSEFFRWWNDTENGLVKTKTVGDFRYIVKFMPPQYLALNELNFKPENKQRFDSLFSIYNKNITFLLTIEPAVEKDVDVLFKGIISYDEYKERIVRLNFTPGDFISVSAGEKSYKPVLATMENVYNLSPKKSIYLVFTPQKVNDALLASDEITFEFEDYIFMTGLNKFVFERKDLVEIPDLTFAEI